MWRKATCSKSVTFAAFVVASSVALLTGAQAETLNSNQAVGGARFVSTGAGDSGTMNLTCGFNCNGSRATFDGLTGGTFRFPSIPPSGLGPSLTISNLDPATQTWTSIEPNTESFVASFGSDNMVMGNITVTAVQDSLTPRLITLIGDFTETSGTGALGAAFASGGIFNLPMQFNSGTSSPSLAALFAQPSGNGFFFAGGNMGASITAVAAPNEIPLPPAIYLFGSALGGAFWLGRRKRSAVSSLA